MFETSFNWDLCKFHYVKLSEAYYIEIVPWYII